MFFRSIALVRSETITVGLIVVSPVVVDGDGVFLIARFLRARVVPANRALCAIKKEGKRRMRGRDKRSEKTERIGRLWGWARETRRAAEVVNGGGKITR